MASRAACASMSDSVSGDQAGEGVEHGEPVAADEVAESLPGQGGGESVAGDPGQQRAEALRSAPPGAGAGGAPAAPPSTGTCRASSRCPAMPVPWPASAAFMNEVAARLSGVQAPPLPPPRSVEVPISVLA